jgi:hypothetical protein
MKKILFLFVLFTVLVSACKGEADDEIFKISDPAKQLEAEAGMNSNSSSSRTHRRAITGSL